MDLENFPTRPTAKDMLSMVSPIYDQSYVGKWIFEVLSMYLALAQDTVDDLKAEAFPNMADWTLDYWEQAYGIQTNHSLTKEQRRSALIQKMYYRRPMNPKRIEALVKEACGREVELVENTAPHCFEIRIKPGTAVADIDAVLAVVRKVKQSQKSVSVIFQTDIGLNIKTRPLVVLYPNIMSGTRPHINYPGKLTPRTIEIHPDKVGKAYDYEKCGRVTAGTKPVINRPAVITPDPVELDTEASGTVYQYLICGDVPTGTKPGINRTADLDNLPGLDAHIAGTSAGVVYKICGAKRLKN